MLSVRGTPDLIRKADHNANYQVEWVDIQDPDRAHSPGTFDGGGVFHQGLAQGGSPFARLEGCWWGNNVCYFVSTSGGKSESGQIWQYDPIRSVLKLVFESTGPNMLDRPDNITVSPRGGLVICEDGDRVPQKLHSLSLDGQINDLAWNKCNSGRRETISRAISGIRNGQEHHLALMVVWLFREPSKPRLHLRHYGTWESLGI